MSFSCSFFTFSYFFFLLPNKTICSFKLFMTRYLTSWESTGKATFLSLEEFIPVTSSLDNERSQLFFNCYSYILKNRECPFFLGRRRLRVAGRVSMNLPLATLQRRWQPTVITRFPITSPTTCTILESWSTSGCMYNTFTYWSTSIFWWVGQGALSLCRTFLVGSRARPEWRAVMHTCSVWEVILQASPVKWAGSPSSFPSGKSRIDWVKCQTVHLMLAHHQLHLETQLGTHWPTYLLFKSLGKGSWMAQSVKHLTSTQVNPRVLRLSPALGSLLDVKPASPSLSAPPCPPFMLCLSNKWIKSLKTKTSLGRKQALKKLFQETPKESSYNQPYSLRPKFRGQEVMGNRGCKSKFVLFPVKGVQREEALRLLLHRTVGCHSWDCRKAEILCLWWDYGVQWPLQRPLLATPELSRYVALNAKVMWGFIVVAYRYFWRQFVTLKATLFSK